LCAAHNLDFQGGGVEFDLDCFKGGSVARWFEKAFVEPIGSNRLALLFKERKPSLGQTSIVQTLYKCPSENETDTTPLEQPNVSQWTHNGSVMAFSETHGSLEIDYVHPRPGMLTVGFERTRRYF
jgi:hypothetical protein